MIELNSMGIQLFIAEPAIRIVTQFRQSEPDAHEAGGILLGEVGNQTSLILTASIPSRADKSTRTSFFRDRNTAQRLVKSFHAKSVGRTTYLGEWHTHPEDHAKPSTTDFQMLRNQRRIGRLSSPFIFLIVIGRITDSISCLVDGQIQTRSVTLGSD